MKKTCEWCRWWDKQPDTKTIAYCRFSAPTGSSNSFDLYPITDNTMFCSKWELNRTRGEPEAVQCEAKWPRSAKSIIDGLAESVKSFPDQPKKDKDAADCPNSATQIINGRAYCDTCAALSEDEAHYMRIHGPQKENK
ncbi:MAG: hypothetical protein GY833_16425 [Aestuariibacter sp.]|nr:hypothetical protein [Aestuariibacter sp.]